MSGMIWIAFACLTAFAVACVLWPLALGAGVETPVAAAAQFYKAQAQAIERDRDAGLMSPDDAAMALTEAARRALGTSFAARAFSSSRIAVKSAAVAIIVGIPLFSVLFYLRTGNPDMPDAPLSMRLTGPPEQTDIAAMIARMEAHVAAHPDDGRALELLAPVYMRLGRAADAAKAYAKVLALLGESAKTRADYAEALVAMANGEVTPEARQNFETALASDPASDKARFYLARAAEQDGDMPLALDFYRKLLAGAPPAAPYLPYVRRRLAELGAGMPPSAAAAAVVALPDEERMKTIRSMVDGLAARLEQDGHDGEGWLKLIRAYSVLREAGPARTALDNARRALAGDAAALEKIGNLAAELGMEDK